MNIKISFFCFFSLLLYSCEDGDNYKVNISGSSLGHDPLAYEKADLMYSSSDTLKFDNIAIALIRNVSESIDNKLSVESDNIWGNLIKLEPYRKSAEVQSSMKIWSRKSALFISGNISRTNTNLDEFLKKYKEIADTSQKKNKNDYLLSILKRNDLKNLSDYGRKLLMKDPRNLDLRNNLALCQMHLNLDLTSQLELEILRSVDSTYSPSLINLTVIYEREGRSGDARKLARELYLKRYDIPIVRFNYAWYSNLDSNYVSADSVLKKTLALDESSKFKSFYDLNRLQLKAAMSKISVMDAGIFRKFGFRDTPGRVFGCFLLFLIASIIFWVILFNLSEWIIALIYLTFYIPYLFYAVFWGSPSGWSLLWLLFFYLITILVVSAKRLAKI